MQYRTLGASGCSITSFALGAMTFGKETPEAEAFAILDYYVEAGGNLIDTADVYVGGESERIIGRWLAARAAARDNMVVATKGRLPMGTGPNQLGLSRRYLSEALDASLRRLGVDCIDLYQVHAFDPVTPLEETLRFLGDAVTAGKIHYYGLSNFTGWQLQRAYDVAEAIGIAKPVTLQPEYNLLTREVEWEIIPAARFNGMGLLTYSPLGGGWLTGKYSPSQEPGDGTRLGDDPDRGVESYSRRGGRPATWRTIEAVQDVAGKRGVSMGQVAIAWVKSRPGVSSVILGARTLQHLEGNLVEVELTEAELRQLTAASEPEISDYPYGERGQLQRTRKMEGGR